MFQLPSRLARGLSLSSVLNLWRGGNECACGWNRPWSQRSVSDFGIRVHPRKLGRRIFRFNARPRSFNKTDTHAFAAPLVALEDITPRKEQRRNLPSQQTTAAA